MNTEEFIDKLKVVFNFDENKVREQISEASPEELDREYNKIKQDVFDTIKSIRAIKL